MENENTSPVQTIETKFCKHCGEKIPKDAVLCTHCGRQVEEINNQAAPQVVVNNTNANSNVNQNYNNALDKKMKNKWVSLCLCFFLGAFGAHKFYEGKVGMGILYLLTLGLCGIGIIIDFIVILTKPNPYLP